MSPALTEWEAAHAANLDLHRWDSGGYPGAFMAKVMGWYARHRQLELHREDARTRAVERMQKRGR
jgi:hypothetical protein